jgi:hypothetical protein
LVAPWAGAGFVDGALERERACAPMRFEFTIFVIDAFVDKKIKVRRILHQSKKQMVYVRLDASLNIFQHNHRNAACSDHI